MNEITTLPDMNLEEATAKHAELKSLHSVMRSMFLEMRDRKGWLALGYTSWEEYGDKEWEYGRQYLDRLATASRIESIVAPMGAKQIPERQLRPLTSVPDDIKKQIWDQVTEENKDVTAKLVQQAVDKYKAELAEKDKLIDAVRKQRDDWKDVRDQKINELTNSQQAAIQAAIAKSKEEIAKLNASMVRIRETQSETINKGVAEKLREIQAEVDHKQRTINFSERRIAELKQEEVELEQRVGKIVRHNKAIAEVQRLLESLYCPIFSIMDDKEWDVPQEIADDWIKINQTVQSLLSTTGTICENIKPEIRVVKGEFVNDAPLVVDGEHITPEHFQDVVGHEMSGDAGQDAWLYENEPYVADTSW